MVNSKNEKGVGSGILVYSQEFNSSFILTAGHNLIEFCETKNKNLED